MTTQTYYTGGAPAVVPAGINISTTPLSDSRRSSYRDVQKPPQPPVASSSSSSPKNQRGGFSSGAAPVTSPTAAAAYATSPANTNGGATSARGGVGGAGHAHNTSNSNTPATSPTNAAATGASSSSLHSDRLATASAAMSTSHHLDDVSARGNNNDDDGAMVGGGEHDSEENTNEALDYCGVRLLPGVEQIDFDEGYYVGTIDENGEMAGYGKATWHTGDTYEGEWLDGMMHGKGTYTWTDGDYYRGDYVRGRMEGYGEMKDTTGLYTGEWVGDMRQGYGRMVYTGGNIYEGEWLAGMRHGPGKLIEVAANVTYEGEFNRNEKEGRGVQTNADGDVYEGEFANGKPNGRGTYLWTDGSRYIGMFKDGVKDGDGCEWMANGDWVAGLFRNGEHVDDHSTRHKATVLLAPMAGEEEEEMQQQGDGALEFDQNGNAIRSGEILSDEAAAAVLAPLDPEELRRITELACNPATSANMSRRNTPANLSEPAVSPTNGSVRRGGDNAADRSSSISLALSAPPVFLEDADLEGWTPLKTIGKGSFGAVYTALLRNGRTVCCKVIELGNVENEEEMEKLRNEIALMKRLRHPNCVQYYGSLEDKTKNTLNIFMEYVSGGTLTSFVNKFGSIPLSTLRQWAYQMICGVRYLHECGIVHRDIKGDNVLVSVDGIVKLADFGCSKAIDDVCSATHGCTTMVGTPYWMAPEVIKCEAGGYGMKSDVWSIGCTIVEMLTGKPPWPECNSMWAAVYKIANSTGLPTEIPRDVDPELMDLLTKCFERNPKLRPTAAELLKHPFLTKAADGTASSTASNSASRR